MGGGVVEKRLCGQFECECCAEASDLFKRIAALEAALRQIAELPDVDADQRGVIARDALAGKAIK